MLVNRRTLLKSLISGCSLALTHPGSWLSEASDLDGHFRIWDMHSHLHGVPGDTPEERMAVLIQFADRLGIERLILSQGYSAEFHPTSAQIREENDRVLRAFRRFPDRAYGSVYLSPAYPEFSLQ
ncbi:MAG TPA: hypothetical protein VMW38_19765, partial [Terriglobia bacterium]|nr:hypothetical protein [Terriglobia bacterium]